MIDDMKHNFKKIKNGWWLWGIEMKDTMGRFRHARVFSKGTDPEQNNNVFHLSQNVISETIRLPYRTWSYMTTVGLIVLFCMWANNAL